MAKYETYCHNPECGILFTANRKDQKYHSSACRLAHFRARKEQQALADSKRKAYEQQILAEIEPIQAEIRGLEEKIQNHQRTRKEIPREFLRLKTKQKELQSKIDDRDRSLNLSPTNFYNRFLNRPAIELAASLKEDAPEREIIMRFNRGIDTQRVIQQFLVSKIKPGSKEDRMVNQEKERIKKNSWLWDAEMAALRLKIKEQKKKFHNRENPVPAWSKKIEANEARIAEIRKKAANPPRFEKLEPKEMKPIRRFGNTQKKERKGKVNVRDLRNMEFNTITLDDELGSFLGEIERNMAAFALTGNPGAGKSQFTYFISRLCMDRELSVMYFSLEEGLGKGTIEKLDRAMIETEDPIEFERHATLAEVRNAAGVYDVIIIDSWQKLGAKPEEFDRLRQDFPNTIFVVVFQKTSGGKIRGGTMINYDCTAEIDVIKEDGERVAFMKKSRYGTQGWKYNINRHEIISRG